MILKNLLKVVTTQNIRVTYRAANNTLTICAHRNPEEAKEELRSMLRKIEENEREIEKQIKEADIKGVEGLWEYRNKTVVDIDIDALTESICITVTDRKRGN